MKGTGLLAPSPLRGQSLRYTRCPDTSLPTGKNLNLSMIPAVVKALGQGMEVCANALIGRDEG